MDSSTSSLVGLLPLVIVLPLVVFLIVSFWKIYTKAGQPGWAVLIPIYNAYVWLKIAGRPGWWLLLYLIPVVNIVIQIIVANDVCKAFGKTVGFTVLMVLLPFIAGPILGFGSATYTKPATA